MVLDGHVKEILAMDFAPSGFGHAFTAPSVVLRHV